MLPDDPYRSILGRAQGGVASAPFITPSTRPAKDASPAPTVSTTSHVLTGLLPALSAATVELGPSRPCVMPIQVRSSKAGNQSVVAVSRAFKGDLDYAMLHKIYGEDPEAQKRYSPATCIGVEGRVVTGDPDPEHVSTSYVERANLTMRMGMRRFTRLTNGFSKKIENHAAAVALHFQHYNFARPHKSLKNPYPRTPAMAAGVADHIWTLKEIAGLLD